MDRCNSVHAVASDYRKICHSDFFIPKHRHAAYGFVCKSALLFEKLLKSAVNFFDYHVYTRHYIFHQRNAPFFTCFRQNRVVCERYRVSRYLPCRIPVESFFVNEHADELRYAKRRVRVVYMYCNSFGKIFPLAASVFCFVIPDYQANASRSHEIFLTQPEFSSDSR